MEIYATIDTRGGKIANRDNVVVCPACGKILAEVIEMHNRGIFSVKCKWCKSRIIAKAYNGQK